MNNRKMAEKIVEDAFNAEVQLKAAMLVIHRVSRTMEPDVSPAKQREAMDALMKFADAHPLPANLERLL